MKLNYIGLCLLIIISFIITDKVANIAFNNNKIVKEIKKVKSNYETTPVSAVIMNDEIIPGINGLEVNVNKSYNKMNKINSFNELFLVYNHIKPEVSLEDNKDKVIINGNIAKNKVSLIINNNYEILSYLVNNNYKINSLFTGSETLYKGVEYLNNSNEEGFDDAEYILNKNKINKNICFVNASNKRICVKENKYLVKNNYQLTENNIIDIKNKIGSGSIVLVNTDAKLSDVKVLLNMIKSKNLDITYLSELILENKIE